MALAKFDPLEPPVFVGGLTLDQVDTSNHDELARRIEYVFTTGDHLERALIHSSHFIEGRTKTRDNERLEFLGDRVLGLVIAEMLFEAFPQSEEGKLAPRLNALVRKETCADVARTIGLGAFLKMSAGEDQAGGREKTAILGDACEALIAAVYLDGGFEAAKAVVVKFWEPLLSSVQRPPRDAKTVLQEWLQGRKMPPPNYTVVERSGPDHEPSFTISVEIPDMPSFSATAGSKRAAEQAAAEGFLKSLGLIDT